MRSSAIGKHFVFVVVGGHERGWAVLVERLGEGVLVTAALWARR